MRFTCEEIKEQKFKKKMRGLDPEEVEVFIHMVADDFEEFEKENATLKNKIKDCKLEIASLQESESSLKKQLTEKKSAVSVPSSNGEKEKAEEEAREIILTAKQKAKEIKEIAMNEALMVEKEIRKIRELKKQLEGDEAELIVESIDEKS